MDARGRQWRIWAPFQSSAHSSHPFHSIPFVRRGERGTLRAGKNVNAIGRSTRGTTVDGTSSCVHTRAFIKVTVVSVNCYPETHRALLPRNAALDDRPTTTLDDDKKCKQIEKRNASVAIRVRFDGRTSFSTLHFRHVTGETFNNGTFNIRRRHTHRTDADSDGRDGDGRDGDGERERKLDRKCRRRRRR